MLTGAALRRQKGGSWVWSKVRPEVSGLEVPSRDKKRNARKGEAGEQCGASVCGRFLLVAFFHGVGGAVWGCVTPDGERTVVRAGKRWVARGGIARPLALRRRMLLLPPEVRVGASVKWLIDIFYCRGGGVSGFDSRYPSKILFHVLGGLALSWCVRRGWGMGQAGVS